MNDETTHYELINSLRYMLTAADKCSYLDDNESINLFVDPAQDLDKKTYSALAQQGFRRSGEYVYRPHCSECRECRSTRVLAKQFQPSRSQRRILKLNSDIKTSWRMPEFDQEHFDLYQTYMKSRHQGSSMDTKEQVQYENFINSSWCDTRLMQFHLEDQLIAVAMTDFLENGISAVYTFFEPSMAKRSLGGFAILKQIEYLQQTESDYLYLGYWIKACKKMAYKNNYLPSEYFDGHYWQAMPSESEPNI